MRLAVLSDIHANHTALEAVLRVIYAGEYDGLVFLGDYVTDCPYPRKTVEILRNIPESYQTWFVRGNREDYIINYRKEPVGWAYNSKTGALLYTYESLTDEDIDWLASHPVCHRIALPCCPEIIACHGSPEKNNYLFHTDTPEAERIIAQMDAEVMLCGHSHTPFIFRRGERMLVNSGALGMPQNGQTTAQFAQLTCTDGKWDAEIISVPYDIERTVSEFFDSGLYEKSGTWAKCTIAILRHGRNFAIPCLEYVCAQAEKRGLSPDDEQLWKEAESLLPKDK